MESKKVGSATDQLLEQSQTRLASRTNQKEAPSVPGQPLANPLETARSAVNAASLMTAMMAPTSDGIYAIGAVAVKIGTGAIKTVSTLGNSWGFWLLAVIANIALDCNALIVAVHS